MVSGDGALSWFDKRSGWYTNCALARKKRETMRIVSHRVFCGEGGGRHTITLSSTTTSKDKAVEVD